MKTVAIYERVSTLHQSEEGYSIGEQEERLKLFAQAHRWVVTKVYSDPGYSGGKLDRPGIQMLIKDAKLHSFDAVLIYKLDRLSRSQKDTLYLIEDVFNPNGVGLISLMENFDTTTSFGKAMIGILSVFAQLERGQITERMTMGRVGRAKAGYYAGGSKPPIGYTYSKVDGGEKKTLQVDDYEAMQVREVFRLFLKEDYSFSRILRYMHERYTTRYGDWSNVSTVSRMLRDRTYIGEISFGGQYYPGIHTPIIDKETFDAVQVKYDRYLQTTAGTSSQNYKGNHLLTGLIWCGECGGRMFVKSYFHKHKDGSIRYWRDYACYTSIGQSRKMSRGKPECKNVKVPLDELDQLIIDEVQKLALDPELVRTKATSHQEAQESINRAAVQGRLDELSRQEEKLIDLYQIGAIDIDAVRKRADDIKAEKDKLSVQLAEEQKASPAALSPEEAIQRLGTFSDVFTSGTLQEKNQFLRALIDRIDVYPDKVEIHWAFEAKK